VSLRTQYIRESGKSLASSSVSGRLVWHSDHMWKHEIWSFTLQ